MKNKYQVVALIGKAGAGKDTIQAATCKAHPDYFHPIVSYTTRPAREKEIDGVDYHFISAEDFLRKVMKNEMLEASEFRNWFYGTSIDSLDANKINIGVFNPTGAHALLKDPRIEASIVYVTADDKTRLMRYLQREEVPDCAEMCRRFLADEKDFENLPFDYYFFENYDGNCIDLASPTSSLEPVLERLLYCLKQDVAAFRAEINPIKAESKNYKDNIK